MGKSIFEQLEITYDPPGGGSENQTPGNSPTPGQTGPGPKEKKENPAGLNILTIPEPPKNKGGRPKGSKTGGGAVAKKGEELEALTLTCSALLLGGFAILAAAAGDHWNLTAPEAEGVAAPLARIIDRMAPAESMNKHMDYVLLVAGLVGIVLPRIMEGRKKGKQEDGKRESKQVTASPGNPGGENGGPKPDNGGGLKSYMAAIL